MTLGFDARLSARGTKILTIFFLVGLYLGIQTTLPNGIPVPGFLAGIAGAMLLFAHRTGIRERHLFVLSAVLMLYLCSIIMAPGLNLLHERFKGFVQLSYSILISYGFFLAATRTSRRQLAGIFLWLCIVILFGCLLETHTGFRAISDGFRERFFDTGLYIADMRDQFFYGIIRPKLFTSEPSAVTFMFSLFAFSWYVLSQARKKVLLYLALLGAGYYLQRGPTLFLGVALIPIYEVLLASRRGLGRGPSLDIGKVSGGVLLAAILTLAAIPLLQAVYPERLDQIFSGEDPSFFSRVIAPPMVAFKVIANHPLAGAGLTGWEYLENITQQIYSSAEWFSSDYRFGGAAESITNYFWLHWIFLGLFWGGLIMVALIVMVRSLGAPSALFCLSAWAIFGQGSGSYVGPHTWSVLFLTAAISLVHERDRIARATARAVSRAQAYQMAPQRQEPFLNIQRPRTDIS